MKEEADRQVAQARNSMNKVVQHLENELANVRAGKASVHMLDGITVLYYGTETPIHQVANISATDARTLIIQPWEKTILKEIEKSIIAANIGINPINDGSVIRLVVPQLTEERRIGLVKQVKNMAEQSKISIRNIRRDTNIAIKNLQKQGLSEDLAKDTEDDVQSATKEFSELIDEHVEAKEKEIMTV